MLLQSILFLITIIPSIISAYQCHCKKHTEIRCVTNATSVDLCFSCQSYQTNCLNATSAYFHYPSICAAVNITSCCPNVRTVYVDNEILCPCYCPLQSYGIEVLNSTPMFQCDCDIVLKTATAFTIIPTAKISGENPKSQNLAVGLSVGIVIPLAIFIGVFYYCFRKTQMSSETSCPLSYSVSVSEEGLSPQDNRNQRNGSPRETHQSASPWNNSNDEHGFHDYTIISNH